MTEIPAINGSDMAQVDQAMFALGLDTLQLMELAGFAVVTAVERWLGAGATGRIVALAGTGGNGGDAMVAARILAAHGRDVSVVLTHPREHYRDVPAHQLHVLEAMGIAIAGDASEMRLAEHDVIIDGLLGFSLHGNPRGRVADLIRWANASPAPIIAIDLPSGLDADTGAIGDPCIRARQTVTLALPKTGLRDAPEVTGDVLIGDIGVPTTVYTRFGVTVSPDLFRNDPLVPWGNSGSRR